MARRLIGLYSLAGLDDEEMELAAAEIAEELAAEVCLNDPIEQRETQPHSEAGPVRRRQHRSSAGTDRGRVESDV
jgi:hypothetical protein